MSQNQDGKGLPDVRELPLARVASYAVAGTLEQILPNAAAGVSVAAFNSSI